MKSIIFAASLCLLICARVFAADTVPGYNCRAIAVTGFGESRDIFTDDSNRGILTVVNFSIALATDGKGHASLYGNISPRDTTMGQAFALAQVLLNGLRDEGHRLPNPMIPNPGYASNPDAACNDEAVHAEVISEVERWMTSAFPRFAKTPVPGTPHAVVVYAWHVSAPPPAPAPAQNELIPPAYRTPPASRAPAATPKPPLPVVQQEPDAACMKYLGYLRSIGQRKATPDTDLAPCRKVAADNNPLK